MNNKIVYIAQSFKRNFNAGVKPTTDFETVLRRFNAKNIGLKGLFFKLSRLANYWSLISAKLARLIMPSDGIVYLQYPCQPDIESLLIRAKQKNNKIIMLVHDINELRGIDNNNNNLLNEADALIVHTPNMKKWIEERFPKARCVVLNIFDYLCDFIPSSFYNDNINTYKIAFAGNLAKAPFLYHIKDIPTNIIINLYGKGLDESQTLRDRVHYSGSFWPEELPSELEKNHFGLVWDGDSIYECSGNFGKYLKYNAPYKVSSYLASGIPVIVWDKMGIAEFVKRNNIGLVVSDFNELFEILSHFPKGLYLEMRNNVKTVQEKIRSGNFYEYAITESLRLLK